MTVPPLPMRWEGDGFVPATPYWAKEADKHFVVGQVYTMEIREQRSIASHNHFFASIAEAHQNLPEHLAERWATPDHLRRWALIRAGFHDERSIVCASKAEARRIAAFVKPMDTYAIVTARDAVVLVYTAKSQSMKAMGKADFQRSKDAVLEIISGLIGTSSGDLARNAMAEIR